MPVGEEHAVDRRQIDAQSRRVVLPHRRVGPHVEEQSVAPIAASPVGEHGKAMAGAAEAIEHDLAGVPGEFARRRESREQTRRFGE